jgi:DNA-binding CsgD family transcriptional regulator
LENINRISEEYSQKANRMEADLSKAFLCMHMGVTDEVADWLRQGSPTELSRRLFLQALPFAYICRAGYLLLTNQPEILLGEASYAMGLSEALRYPLAQLYLRLQIAVARLRLDDRAEALSNLRAALKLARPDKLLLPLAVYYQALKPVLNELPETIPNLLALTEKMDSGIHSIRKGPKAEQPLGLTNREYETASLAAEGLFSQAIAEKLGVTVHTVKAHLKAVYRKTGAKTRLGLHKILQKQSFS